MKNHREVLAFDLGASSGRGILAGFDGSRIELREIHRFPNSFSLLGDRAYWDILWLLDNIKKGLGAVDGNPASLGIDTWGVDFGLLDKTGGLLSMPRSYRDNAFSTGNMREAVAFFGEERWLFQQTYLTNWEINPLFKLYHMKKTGEEVLDAADTLLMMPNLIEYFLTGIRHSEYTISATSQLYNMKHKTWAVPLLDKLGIPPSLFTPVDYAGRILGPLSAAIAGDIGRRNLQVISVAGHDTASAALAVPADSRDFTFISSGTWSLLCNCSATLLEDETIIQRKIANEGNWDGTYRSTVNISGLWILQECRKQWNTMEKTWSYDELEALARAEKPLQSLVRPEDFEKAGDYPQRIRDFCKKTGQPIPENKGSMVRCILESLALKYRQAYDLLKPYINHRDAVYIVGGGVKNRLLNQFTANALGIPVLTGPPEATAVGNILIQLEALGELEGDSQRGDIIRNSFESASFFPRDRDVWEAAYHHFLGLYDPLKP